MALLDRVGEVLFEGLGGSLLLGVGVVLVAPVTVPVLRPVTKQIVKGGLLAADKVKEYVAETGEKWGDLMAEVKAEVETTSAPKKEILFAPTLTDLTKPPNTAPAAEPSWHQFEQIPEFKAETAEAAWQAGYRSFDDIRTAAENDKLRELPGIGKARQAAVLQWLQENNGK
ncbi:MAG: DUF5132 domain-containing protein [Caldilineaceae bacterium]